MSLAQVFSKIFLWLAIIAALAGLAFLAGNLHYFFSSEQLEAQITDYTLEQNPIPFSDENSGKVYYPIVSVVQGNNEVVEFESSIPRNSLDFSIGDSVMVRFIPGQRDSYKIDSFMDLWGQSIIFFGIALFFLVSSLVSRKGFDQKKY
jgi:hypothetical protein